MCGIYGVFSFEGARTVEEAQLAAMGALLKHRGPDGEGRHLACEHQPGCFKVGLGHRRLAIVDKDSGQQPMSNEGGDLWLVCDGEIYNHEELRKACCARGHRFSTCCDVEVILHLYEDYGEACLGFLRGIFAFALWDEKKRALFLCRDRLGIKHLNYAFTGGHFIFASEIKAILSFPGIKRRLNGAALDHYLTFLASAAPDTFFEGIQKIPAGHSLTVAEDGRHRLNEYWDIFSSAEPADFKKEEDCLEYISQRLNEAVSSQITPGLAAGVFLSGGVDSSLVAAYLARQVKGLRTFTTGYHGGGSFDETEQARRVSHCLGTQHQSILVGEKEFGLSGSSALMYFQEEPVFEPICLSYFISAAARAQNTVVCYTGTGGDELFLGYPHWLKLLRYKKYFDRFSMLPLPLRRGILKGVEAAGSRGGTAWTLLKRLERGESAFFGSTDLFYEVEKDALIGNNSELSRYRGAADGKIRAYYQKFRSSAFAQDPADFMTYLDLKTRVAEVFLLRTDRMSMAHGVETRVPILDHRFVASVAGIPSRLKVNGGIPKVLLKKMFKRLLPGCEAGHIKKGWGLSARQWYFDRSVRDGSVQERLEFFSRRTGIFDKKYLDRLFHRLGNEKNRFKAWQLFYFAAWHEYWIEGRRPS